MKDISDLLVGGVGQWVDGWVREMEIEYNLANFSSMSTLTLNQFFIGNLT